MQSNSGKDVVHTSIKLKRAAVFKDAFFNIMLMKNAKKQKN